MTEYIHDEWCASRYGSEGSDECNCYVAVIRRLEPRIEALKFLRDPERVQEAVSSMLRGGVRAHFKRRSQVALDPALALRRMLQRSDQVPMPAKPVGESRGEVRRMSNQAPLKETDFMRFGDMPNPGGTTRRIAVYSKSQGSRLGSIVWYGCWHQYIFEPEQGTLFNVGCLGDLADRLGYLNTMHKEIRRRPPTSPAQATPSALPRELGQAADSAPSEEATG